MKEEILLAQLDGSATKKPADQISDLRDLVNDLFTERTLIMHLIKQMPYSAGTFIKEGDPLETLRNFQGRLVAAAAEAEAEREELTQVRRDISALRRIFGTETPFD